VTSANGIAGWANDIATERYCQFDFRSQFVAILLEPRFTPSVPSSRFAASRGILFPSPISMGEGGQGEGSSLAT